MIYEDAIQKMKPCPFCGQKDELSITSKEIFNELEEEDGRACIKVRCGRCDLEKTDYHFDFTDYNDRLVLLVITWNERHSR